MGLSDIYMRQAHLETANYSGFEVLQRKSLKLLLYYFAISVSSISTKYDHNKSFTDILTTILWLSSEYTL